MEGDSNRFSRLSREEKRTSQITFQPLSDSKVRGSLSSLKELVSSALGPFGRLKFFQTCTGGYVTVTSTSSKIIHNLSCLTHPILKLILSSVRGHLDTYNDGGLRTALLALSLLESSLDLAVPRALTVKINEHALEVLTSHMESCGWKMTIDVGNIKSMLTVVGSVMGTKPACHLIESEKRFLSVLLIEAFIQSLPTINSPSTMTAPVPIQIMTCEGDSVQDSKILKGVLLEAPEIPTFQANKLLISSRVKVALYNISMAGDTEEWFNNGVETEALIRDQDIDMTSAVLQQMVEVADWLVLNGVQMVACQKCMHPALKQHLRDKGAVVIDRLSILHISAVQRLTGSTLLSTFSKTIPESAFGFVGRIEHVVIREMSYIHLQPQSSPTSSAVCTLLVCSPNETSLDELKLVCQASLSALYETIAHPFVVPGAGCLETHLAARLRHHGQNDSSQVMSKLGCTKGQFLSVINNVASCLETLANNLEHDGGGHVIDLASHHHWSLPPEPLKLKPSVHHCMCGLVSRDPGSEWSMMGSCQNAGAVGCSGACQETEKQQTTLENSIVDVFSMKMNLYKTAFETANVIIRVHSLVCSDVAH